MTQPAVTMQIRSLEQYFGTKLFHRSTKKVALSDAGEALLPYAMQAIEFMKQTEQAMAGYTQSLKAKLQLGASLTFGEYIMPRILGPFAKEYPHISVSMKVMNTKQILDEILSHKLTFGLVEAKVDHPDVQIEPVLSDELKLIVWGDH